MPQARDLPPGYSITRQHGRQYQIHNICQPERKHPGAETMGISSLYPKRNRFPGSTGARTLSMRAPIRLMARPITSSGPAGAVVDATSTTSGFMRTRCWRKLCQPRILPRGIHFIGRRGAKTCSKPLAHNILKKLAGAVRLNEIGVKDADRWPANGTSTAGIGPRSLRMLMTASKLFAVALRKARF